MIEYDCRGSNGRGHWWLKDLLTQKWVYVAQHNGDVTGYYGHITNDQHYDFGLSEHGGFINMYHIKFNVLHGELIHHWTGEHPLPADSCMGTWVRVPPQKCSKGTTVGR